MTMSFSRSIFVSVATILTLTSSAAPTWADAVEPRLENKVISLPGGRGDMIFHDDGDVFEVCDTKKDGEGVTGFVIDKNTGKTVLAIDDGGDVGCDKFPYDVDIFRDVRMQLITRGYSVTSEWFSD